jgi:hypothetical protein
VPTIEEHLLCEQGKGGRQGERTELKMPASNPLYQIGGLLSPSALKSVLARRARPSDGPDSINRWGTSIKRVNEMFQVNQEIVQEESRPMEFTVSRLRTDI